MKRILWWVCLLLAPAVLIGLELFHPANFTNHPGMYQYLSQPEPHSANHHEALDYFGPRWWLVLHMIQTPMVGLRQDWYMPGWAVKLAGWNSSRPISTAGANKRQIHHRMRFMPPPSTPLRPDDGRSRGACQEARSVPHLGRCQRVSSASVRIAA